MTTLKEKSQKLLTLRHSITKLENEFEAGIQPLKLERDLLQRAIIEDLKAQEQLSAKYEFATITRQTKKTLQILDESRVMDYLKKQKLYTAYVSPRLNDEFKTFASEAIKQNLVIDGTQIRESEYISIREPKTNGANTLKD